ncbi:uncharacterized protein LOC144453646 [Glandiceps talaboti]
MEGGGFERVCSQESVQYESDAMKHRKAYWELRSKQYKDFYVRSVMLFGTREAAEEESRLEIEQYMSALPSLEGKVVCDLPAGIGRYTGLLAKKAKHVTAVDLIESYTRINKEKHGYLGNIDFVTDDAINLKFQAESFDLMFCNYLMQYLDDSEARMFAANALTWLTEGGYLFTRDENEVINDFNELPVSYPTVSRSLSSYKDILSGTRIPAKNKDENYQFSLVSMSQVQSVKVVSNLTAKRLL